MTVHVLSIAGSDPSGGAGLQADLKTFAALGAYGMAAVTSLTVQNTRGVRAVHPVPPEVVVAQVGAVLDDIRVDAVKIGLLGPAAPAIAELLRTRRPPWVVLDPVMVSTSGDRLAGGEELLGLLPLVDLVTPNVPEAAALLGVDPARDEEGQRSQALSLHAEGCAVLLKGGHLAGAESVDVLVDGGAVTRLAVPRVETRNTHGTGCTLSSALAASRPVTATWAAAAARAKDYVTRALLAAADLDVGHGNGPLRHDVAVPENASYASGSQGPPR